MQASRTALVGHLHVQAQLSSAQGAVVGHWPVQTRQAQQRLHQTARLAQCQAKQVIDGQTKLEGCIRELGAAPALTAGRGKPAPDDQRLLLISDQLRDLLAGKGWDTNRGPGSAALPISLLLLSKAGVKRQGKGLNAEMGTLHEAMTLLSVTVDREIVSRMLHREDGTIGSELMESLRLLAQSNSEPVRPLCTA